MNESTLPDLTAHELIDAYRRRALSPTEVVRATLQRIRACEPTLHACWLVDESDALAQAEASEARWRSGAPCGPLDGVPLTLKENIATAGVPVPLGSAATDKAVAPHDSPPAARLREAGAVLVGKTTMPDYGMLSSGLSSFHALARNPWNLERTPGGSSAGAGAAAAAGYGPLHIGTDIGGSVRLPAGWCGVFGLKPSFGRIPIDPTYAGRVAGPMTRRVADAALMMGPLSRPDARDPTSLPWLDIAWMNLERDIRGLRVGLWLDAGVGLPVEPGVRSAVVRIARALEAAGAVIELVEPFVERTMLDGMDDFWRTRSWIDLCALDPARRALVLPYIVEWARAAEGFDGARVFHGYSQMAALRDAALAACRRHDFVISPTAPIAAFAAELPSPTGDPQRPFEHIGFTLPFNMSEQPAATVNCGYLDDGLPIGLQIVGARHDDLGVLQIARAVEQLRGPQHAWPLPCAA